ncbi:CDF family Co(II)/Ni(II) efflux transporter DmeF [Lichenicoccus sp.]|uniref:CDF family Co(II)/Ni(II) efflux transporter DmeF n=1 Tax=Lichenicoccus sp. TaxID=2781899 RepID=UPI003D0BD5A3
MDAPMGPASSPPTPHGHVFLGQGHAQAEQRTRSVIALCGAMMIIEIIGGLAFGSIALVADGLHMSTHAGALLLAALAYRYARRYAEDPRFSFGTGKLGDLAGFTSAIMLAMIAVLIGYEAVGRLFAPVPIRFAEAIPIATLGLAVNVASAWLLSGGGHHHDHGHGHHENGHDEHAEEYRLSTRLGVVVVGIFEENQPPVFRIRAESGVSLAASAVSVETVRPGGGRQRFAMIERNGFLQSADAIPEPHAFAAQVTVNGEAHRLAFEEHDHEDGHGSSIAHRDNNMRAAIIHVVADAAVSVMVIIGLLLARAFGWLWMDPLAGIVGACVIASWSFGLIRDTGAILLDMVPDRSVAEAVRRSIEAEGDTLADLHMWRLGPGHLGAIVAIVSPYPREPDFYRQRLAARFRSLSHVTIEVQKAPA